ncbi:MAG TPA: hypothetical protein VKC61_16760 [Pyrinomonadaceae bacterium]|nr:hypothetical protein [Pyrinomonadaceae bacterium]
MKNSDDAQITSRRSFTRSLTVALLVVPAVSSWVNAQKRTTRARQKKQKDPCGHRYHDTPPPITFDDGSFEIWTRDPLSTKSTSAPYQYTASFGGSANISHVKLLDGQGTTLYCLETAKGSTMRIDLATRDKSIIETITVGGGSAIEVTSTRPLTEFLDAHPKGFRPHKYVHPGRSAGEEFRVESIEIWDGVKSYPAKAGDSPKYFSEEFRIMLWLE